MYLKLMVTASSGRCKARKKKKKKRTFLSFLPKVYRKVFDEIAIRAEKNLSVLILMLVTGG